MERNTDNPQSEVNPIWLRRAKIVLWSLAALLIVGTFLLFFTLSRSDLPTFKDLENPEYDLASLIYDSEGTVFGKYYVENRVPITYDQLNPNVLNALVSTEDARFFEHSGIDFRALGRVGFKTLLLSDRSSGGGSTITQQLAKLLFKRPNLSGLGTIGKTIKLINIKLKEWITAVKIERSFTKEEIIQMYLNKFEFINGAHGIEAAAETYFSKSQDELTVDESAVLVGMLKNPSLYNPKRFPEKSKNRRNVVLDNMYRYDFINSEQLDSLSAKELDMEGFERKTQSEGPAPYFRSELTKWLRNLFEKEHITKSDGSSYNIYTDGLKIYTTIDLDYQKHAEAALKEHMDNNQYRYWRVWKNMDPWTYDAEPEEIAIRKDILERRVKSSDRYLKLRDKVLGATIEEIYNDQGQMPLSDNVIKALVNIEGSALSYDKAVSSGAIDKANVKSYKKLLGSDKWTSLKKNWDELLKRYDKEFNTEVKMKVFDHEEGEKEVTMTPRDSVRYHAQHLQGGMLAVDPHSGYIKAWVGGFDHKYFKYDHVNSRRSVGSTIKPFVYATAISLQGLSPCQKFQDIQYTISPGEAAFDIIEPWSPVNANEEFSNNYYNLYQGLLYSKNSITVALVKQMGNVKVVRELLDRAGIDKDLRLSDGRLAVPELPSISLGAVDLTLMEMTGAYTVFANNGSYTQPIFVTRIEDKNGRVIYNGIPERQVALNPRHNAIMVEMLQNNVAGKHSMGLKVPNGGKTGTTNDYTDGWFMGITPDLVVGVWTGGDDPWIRFTNLNDGQGYRMARPVFQKFIKKIEKDTATHFKSNVSFPELSSELFDFTDCDKYNVETPEELKEMHKQKMKAKDEFESEFGDEFGGEFGGSEFGGDEFGGDEFGEGNLENDMVPVPVNPDSTKIDEYEE